MKGHIAINNFAKVQSNENMEALINWAKNDEACDDEIILLAKTLAYSGKIIKNSSESLSADIPSTGGPSSLSTLLCPLVLKELGFIVPKIGVKGRPAGGIDVLAQIPNYKFEFTFDELLNCLIKTKYCHFLAGNEFTPLDALLFQYRSNNKAKSLIPLVISSILSKKIAAGLSITGLDIRVANYGNFGINWEEAKKNAEKFIRISKSVGIEAVCFLNDFTYIQQPYIGRGESLVGLYEIFYGQPNNLLEKHFHRCISMGLTLSSKIQNPPPFLINNLAKHFIDNLVAQGSSERIFLNKVDEIKSQQRNTISAPKSGFLNINLEILRDSIVWGQSTENKVLFSDPCGVIFKKESNSFVDKNETILTYRVSNKIKKEFHNRLMSAIQINTTFESKEFKIIN